MYAINKRPLKSIPHTDSVKGLLYKKGLSKVLFLKKNWYKSVVFKIPCERLLYSGLDRGLTSMGDLVKVFPSTEVLLKTQNPL